MSGADNVPITPLIKAKILELQAAGIGRNAIAREVGCSVYSVTKVAHAAGKDFVRGPGVIAAIEANKVDGAKRRAVIKEQQLEDYAQMQKRLWAPTEYVEHGGKDFDEARYTMNEPTHADKLKLVQAMGALLDRHLKLDAYDSDEHGLAAVDVWLKGILGVDE